MNPWLAFTLGFGAAFLFSGITVAAMFWASTRKAPRFRTSEEVEAERSRDDPDRVKPLPDSLRRDMDCLAGEGTIECPYQLTEYPEDGGSVDDPWSGLREEQERREALRRLLKEVGGR